MQPHTIRSFFTLRRTRWLVSALTIVGLLALAIGAATPARANLAGSDFEAGDGNLTVETPGNTDWNSFSPVTWTGTAPFRQATGSANGWHFAGFEDATKSSSDTGFAGGTKQDQDCASVIGSSAPNKDDLKRIYLASKIGSNGHVYLNLAWVRIPLNNTSSSAHVGFEFNQGTTPCPAGSDGLVHRTAGDMLVVYDFTGGTAGVPDITLRRWVTSGTCEIGSDSPPCWGPAADLSASGFAEAGVDSGAPGFPFPVTDTVAPSTESLGQSEFGEAGIDLTLAGVFSAGQCLSFGQAEGVSRSSGNSGTAAMEDLVGPGPFRIANCGTVVIIKHTDPRGLNQSFSYTSNLSGGQLSCTQTTPTSFSLNDSGNTTGDSSANTQTCTNVPIGSYTVTEGAEPIGFGFESLTCNVQGTGSTSVSGVTATINLQPLDITTCTYVNKQQLGAIKITKTSSKPAGTPLAGAVFSITGPNSFSKSVTTGSDGTVCVDGLPFGSYSVQETAAPMGYSRDDSTVHTVPVNANAKCSDTPFVGVSLSFTDTPLTDLVITVTTEVSGGTTSTITCVSASNVGIGNSPQSGGTATVSANGLKPGTYTCTVVIDP